MAAAPHLSTRAARSVTQQERDFVGSLERGLQVLSVFDRQNPEMTLSEVARKTGLTPATTRRFLLTLQSLGDVGTNGRRFLLRPKVLELGHAFLDSMNVDELLQPHLRELVALTGDSSSVTVLEGSEIVYIANASARRLVRLSAGPGSRFPAYATSTGRVLLAHKDPAQVKEMFRSETLSKITEFTETRPERIAQILEQVRVQDYCAVQDELEVGIVSVAVPLRDATGRVIAAMNCSCVTRRTTAKEMVKTRLSLLRQYAARVADAIHRHPALAHSVTSR
jgi:IclR family pca regulon transcriptional regulator